MSNPEAPFRVPASIVVLCLLLAGLLVLLAIRWN